MCRSNDDVTDPSKAPAQAPAAEPAAAATPAAPAAPAPAAPAAPSPPAASPAAPAPAPAPAPAAVAAAPPSEPVAVPAAAPAPAPAADPAPGLAAAPVPAPAAAAAQPTLFNLRHQGVLPPGVCVYIQSGDTSDFDGYYIAAAAEVIKQETTDFEYVIAVPERRAWRDKEEPDTMKHDPEYLEEVMDTAAQLLRRCCPRGMIVRGVLNSRNIIPWRMMFNEPEKYGPLTWGRPPADPRLSSIADLAARILSPDVTSVVLDMNGSMGYLAKLLEVLGEEGRKVLGAKMKAANIPFIIMAGVCAEVATMTLPLPGRDPRATKNAIYYPEAVPMLLGLAKDFDVPLVFVTNNLCNNTLKFEDATDTMEKMGLRGLLKDISDVWFGMPHLKGKCVPFDWMAFSVMLLHGRKDSAMVVAQQELHVGCNDPSVLVLRDASQPSSDVVEANLKDTYKWGTVGSVMSMDQATLLELAKYASWRGP